MNSDFDEFNTAITRAVENAASPNEHDPGGRHVGEREHDFH